VYAFHGRPVIDRCVFHVGLLEARAVEPTLPEV
jgi:hypothetical protein